MAGISAGRYTVGDLLRQTDFDFEKEAAADYLDGKPDFRRVRIGGLGFDSLDDEIVIPYTADSVEITLDGKEALVLDVELNEEDEEFRRRSFETAADASDPRENPES